MVNSQATIWKPFPASQSSDMTSGIRPYIAVVSALVLPVTTPGCVCDECVLPWDEECVSRRLLEETMLLLLLPELLLPLAGTAIEVPEEAPDWSRNSCEEGEEP